ncbi:hypothetical protein L1785_14950 [Antribacter sp. KLBMP9083]|uniref:DUF3465 domain-containing protein n=1 Tax=Antribacter soli TaxID=2910976 RepID=A0AA41QFQ3_9MICO|nr:hypothetical protein [Antribacter soli]MCF4122276.1 hypothetical protein [Antribacter soli]
MSPRALVLLGVALFALATSSCAGTAGIPDREPDVTGVVAGAGGSGDPVLAEPSDDYFEGMRLLRGDPVIVRGDDGEPVPSTELDDGDEVEVWTDGACAESYPVQCGIVALRLRD